MMAQYSNETQQAIQDATYDSLSGNHEPEEFYELKTSPETQREVSIERFTFEVNCRIERMTR